MRTQTGAVQRYVATNPPDDPGAIAAFLREELAKIQAAYNVLADGQIDVTTVAPTKPREGMIRLADGVTFNPGSGKGVYCYYSNAWHFLG